MRLKNWPAIGLIALALVTCLLVVLAFRHVRPTGDGTTGNPADQSVGAGAQSGTAEPAATSAAPSPASATPTKSATPGPGGQDAVRSAFDGSQPVRVLVLGDESGDADDEWVALWADQLADTHSTTYARWDVNTRGFEPVERKGSGSQVSIFNASHEGSTLTDATRDFARTRQAMAGSASASPTPQVGDSDVVVVSFGYREPAAQFAQNLQKLSAELKPGTPVLVINQAPQKNGQANIQRDRARAATDWADQNGYGSVDVFAAFIAAPEPLAQLLDAKGVLPNARGQQVWADAVSNRLATQ